MSAQPETPAVETPTTESPNMTSIWNQSSMFADAPKPEATPEVKAETPEPAPAPETPTETPKETPVEAPAAPPAEPAPQVQAQAAPDPATQEALQAAEQLGGPEVLKLFAPLFTPFESDTDGRIAAVGADFVRSMAQIDPRIGTALFNGVLQTYKTSVQQEAYQAAGLTPELLDDYSRWVEAGKPMPGLGLPPVPTFPEADADGFVDLNGVMLDIKDPKDKLTYDLAKEQFEFKKGEADRKAARDAEVRTQQEAREREEQIAQAQNAATFFDSLDQRVEKIMNDAPLNFGLNAQIQVEGMPEANIPRMLLGLLHDHFASQDAGLGGLINETKRLAAGAKTGTPNPLLAAKENALARKSEEYIAKSLKIVSHVFSKLGKLEQAVPGAADAPKIPENAIKSETINPSGTPPPVNDPRRVNTAVDDIWKQVSGNAS